MMYRINIVSLLFMLLTTAASAQEIQKPWDSFTPDSNTLNHKLTGTQYYFFSTLNGTAYFNDNWLKGSILLVNGDRYNDIYLKYNTFKEELVVFNERNGAIFVPDKYIISEFMLNLSSGRSEVFRKIYFDKFPKGERYFNILYDGDKLKLLIWHKTIEANVSMYRDKYGIRRATEFRQDITYFILFPDDNLVKISPNRRSFINLLPEQKKEVRKVLRKNRISYSSRESLVKAVELIESTFFSK